MKLRAALGLSVTLVFATSACGLLKKDKEKDTSGSKPAAVETKPGEPAKPAAESAGKAISGCTLPEGPVTTEVTIKKGCSVAIKEHLIVEGGGLLRVEAGVKMTFASGTFMQVRDGKLVVSGTEKEPVILTSGSRTQAAGDWVGILLDEGIVAGSEIQWAKIEFAGADAHGGKGAITLNPQRSSKRVSIANTTFANHEQAAVSNLGDKGAFAKFERNTITGTKISLRAHAAVLGSVGAGNSFGTPLESWGEVTESATWPAFGVPVHMTEHLTVRHDGSAPVLTLAPGTILKFAGGTFMSVGDGNGGGLVAPKCTFTSANASPHAGDWVGLLLYKRSANVNLEGSTIEYAGADAHGGRGAITLSDFSAKEARGLRLAGLTVKHSQQAALSSVDQDCGELAKQISAQGVATCKKD